MSPKGPGSHEPHESDANDGNPCHRYLRHPEEVLLGQLVGYNYFSGLFYSTAGSAHERRALAAGIHEATPIGHGISVNHYSRVLKVAANNLIMAVD